MYLEWSRPCQGYGGGRSCRWRNPCDLFFWQRIAGINPALPCEKFISGYNGLQLDTETVISAGGINVIDRSYDGYGKGLPVSAWEVIIRFPMAMIHLDDLPFTSRFPVNYL